MVSLCEYEKYNGIEMIRFSQSSKRKGVAGLEN